MTRVPKKRIKRKEAEAVETHPDAWERFENAIQKVAPPKRREPDADKSGEE